MSRLCMASSGCVQCTHVAHKVSRDSAALLPPCSRVNRELLETPVSPDFQDHE